MMRQEERDRGRGEEKTAFEVYSEPVPNKLYVRRNNDQGVCCKSLMWLF